MDFRCDISACVGEEGRGLAMIIYENLRPLHGVSICK